MAKKRSKGKRISSKTKPTFSKSKLTFEQILGRKPTEEEELELGRGLLQLARACGPSKKSKKEERDESKSD